MIDDSLKKHADDLANFLENYVKILRERPESLQSFRVTPTPDDFRYGPDAFHAVRIELGMYVKQIRFKRWTDARAESEESKETQP